MVFLLSLCLSLCSKGHSIRAYLYTIQIILMKKRANCAETSNFGKEEVASPQICLNLFGLFLKITVDLTFYNLCSLQNGTKSWPCWQLRQHDTTFLTLNLYNFFKELLELKGVKKCNIQIKCNLMWKVTWEL